MAQARAMESNEFVFWLPIIAILLGRIASDTMAQASQPFDTLPDRFASCEAGLVRLRR